MDSLWTERARAIPTDPFPEAESFDALVVGAGLTGLVTALRLARAGKKVAVLEARRVGAAATGHTTAKLSLLQGTRLSRLLERNGFDVTKAYVEAGIAAQEWLLGFCAERSVPVDRRDAFSYAASPASSKRVNEELEACQSLGLGAERVDELELPFLTYGAVRLTDQAQFDPMDVLAALVDALSGAGGRVFEGTQVVGVKRRGAWEVLTPHGSLFADAVVFATGFPVPDRGGFFARLEAHRSYALAVRAAGALPRGMYLSIDRPTRSLRTARNGEEELLLVGGNDHIVGRHESTSALLEDLLRWTREQFGEVSLVRSWSAQDYRTLDGLPYVGPASPGGPPGLLTATGYDKWGMTNGVAAGVALSGALLGEAPSWAKPLSKSRFSFASVASAIQRNGAVLFEMARGWASCLAPSDPRRLPVEGEGYVSRSGLCPVGKSRVQGELRGVLAVCPHMGGVLRWNDAEKSWDCPLHASRFSREGSRLEGPALRGLRATHVGRSLPRAEERAISPPAARDRKREGGEP